MGKTSMIISRSRSRRLLAFAFVVGAAAGCGILFDNPDDFQGSGSPGSCVGCVDGSIGNGDGAILGDGASAPSLSGPANVLVHQGGTTQVAVTLSRGAETGAFAISVTGLPTGVTAAPVSIAAGATTANVALTATATATQGSVALKIVATESASTSASFSTSLLVAGSPGTLDTTFGNQGAVMLPVTAMSAGQGIAVQPDGKIVVAGYATAEDGSTQRLAVVARLDDKGALDPSFATGGIFADSLGAVSNAGAVAVALQPDGKIALVSNSNDFRFARLTAAGALDPTFKSPTAPPGVSVQSNGGTSNLPAALALHADGRMTAVGYWNNGGSDYPEIGTVLGDGGLDPSFRISVDNTFSTAFEIHYTGVIPLDGGDIVAAGSNSSIITLARYFPDAGRSQTFAGGGVITSPSPSPHILGVATDAAGNFVLVGYSEPTTTLQLFAARFTSSGVLDTTFGNNTGAVSVVVGPNSYGNAIALQADGKIVLVGETTDASSINHLLVVRLNSDGSLDTSFASTGIVTTTVSTSGLGYGDQANAVAIAPDGRIVITGFTTGTVAFKSETVVARYWP